MTSPAAVAKPIDLGNGLICASFDPASAAWLSLGRPHPTVGFVELSALPPFEERHRGNPVATRAHRLAMTDGRHAFLAVEVDGKRPLLVPDLADPARPRWRSRDRRISVDASIDSEGLSQRWQIDAGRIGLRLRGRLDRPALAEITEINPPSPTGAATTVEADGALARVRTAELDAAATILLTGPTCWQRDGDGDSLVASARGPAVLELRVILEIGGDDGAGDVPPATTDRDRLVARALTYVRGCTALRAGRGERAILTDHRILPLSWTRDAYWQALCLLVADGPGDRERVADHLRWLWLRCERPDGRWVRSHHADGRRKDLAFQADQQLYPFIELADYWRMTATLPDGVDWDREVGRAWEAVEREIDPASGLLATVENAADDPVGAPFVASSQILLWYTALRLSEVSEAIDSSTLYGTATAVREAFGRAFRAGSASWPYAVDGASTRIGYHDANDLPVALASLWGFCNHDDPGWRATMGFAFSSANSGWFDGKRPGLGSAHTPGPWTLGDIQAWIRGRSVGDTDAAAAALDRLREVAFADGMLPEAYGTNDPGLRIRHWFAWPGATLAALLMLDRDGRLEMLRAE